MSTRGRRPVAPADVPYELFKKAAIPTLLSAAGCVLVSAVASGSDGAIGALVGAVVIAVFYGTDLVVLRYAERRPPSSLMSMMMATYVIKVVVLALLFLVIWNTTAFDVKAMAVTVAVATVVWVMSLTLFASRISTFSVDVSHQENKRE